MSVCLCVGIYKATAVVTNATTLPPVSVSAELVSSTVTDSHCSNAEYIHTYIHTYIHIYTHIHIYIYIYIPIHIYIYIYNPQVILKPSIYHHKTIPKPCLKPSHEVKTMPLGGGPTDPDHKSLICTVVILD